MGRFSSMAEFCLAVGLLGITTPALANETKVYSYDALGRLISASSSGSVNNGRNATTSYDAPGNRTNYCVGPSCGTAAVISTSNASVAEGGVLTFNITRTGVTTAAASAHFATANGSAAAGSDYTAKSGTISFAANETVKTITVSTTNDTAVEADETVRLNLSAPSSGAVIGSATGTGTIFDNDSGSVLSIANASVIEGGALTFVVTRSGPTSAVAGAHYATANGSASAGNDYVAKSGTVSFAAGEATKSIAVSTINDSLVESDETMAVSLSSPSAGTSIGSASATGMIADDDGPISITDSNFAVLPAHQSTYACYDINIPEYGYSAKFCTLQSSGYKVYEHVYYSSPVFDPGYSMTTSPILQVQPAYYGTGVSP